MYDNIKVEFLISSIAVAVRGHLPTYGKSALPTVGNHLMSVTYRTATAILLLF